jgi:cell division protein FtsQ
MSSDFTFTAPDNINIKTKPPAKAEKSIKKLIVIAAVIFAAELIWLFGVTPFIPFSTVEVQGFEGLERNDILQYAGINDGSSYISTNVREAQKKLEGHILVESAVVMKRFPDKLSIFINPRKAVAVALTNTASGQLPLYVDRHGLFFKYAEGKLLETSPYPILSGFENPQLNMRLPSSLVPLSENLFGIASSSPQLLAAISEIRIESKTWDGYDLVIYPVHSSIKVRLENNLTEDVLRYMLLVLNVFENSSPMPQEIDFRSGMGSYRVKEQSL